MNRAFAITMKRPHEALALPSPIGRKIGEWGKGLWFVLFGAITLFAAGLYIYQVNAAAGKGFTVRHLQNQVQQLRNRVAELEEQSAQSQTIESLQARVQNEGYVPVDRMEFVDATRGAYALAH